MHLLFILRGLDERVILGRLWIYDSSTSVTKVNNASDQ